MPNALITGASRGLGQALARELAAQGWTLVIDGRDPDALRGAAGELSHLTEVTALPGDVTDASHREALLDAAGDRLDLVVNNASELGPSPLPPLARYPLADLRRVHEVDVIAPLGLIQGALTLMTDGGVIIDVTSDAAREPYPGWGGYGSSKAALDQLTAILAAEHPELRVYAADPGDMRTRMHQAAFPGEDISDRPPPPASVPGLLALIGGTLPSGRYVVRELAVGEPAGSSPERRRSA